MFLQVNSVLTHRIKMGISSSFQSFLFAISGEALTQRLRAKIFRTLLRQDVSYFDRPENNTGALCTRLATEASDVQGVRTVLFSIENKITPFVLFRRLAFELEQCYKMFQISVLESS